MAHHDNTITHEEDHEGMDAKKIWSVFFVLLALTGLEFLIALGLVHHWQVLEKGMFVNVLYILLTLAKAYYIVAFFMHLKFEKSGFIVTCSIVFIFIIYFIILLLVEGNYLLHHLNEKAVYPH